MAALELLLVRHGESEANVAASDAERRQSDRISVPARDADVVLSATGREQAEAFGRHLTDPESRDRPDVVWVSPYRRARETAEIALGVVGLALPTRVDERLRDRELGILDGLTSRGVDRLHPDEAARRRFLGKFYYRPPGGESWADVALRVRSVLDDIDRECDGQRVLIVCHDAVVSLIRYVSERLDEADLLDQVRRYPLPNASITRLERDRDGEWVATAAGDIDHLARHDAEVTEHSGEPA
ncbi:histidine phosphatase family protein [Amnibacterium flavum]|uniref:Histidine phosphatase family protein n=1 Tax=Amnibacterium flavum TaxID=2173173 RepID=A0A2V1HQ46_9MICO|nr:histidine phosphatase family protein [Amnibacterium flavum]PVZ94461.1 histidine phosphatase family protein [Amnibacterium flavum]